MALWLEVFGKLWECVDADLLEIRCQQLARESINNHSTNSKIVENRLQIDQIAENASLVRFGAQVAPRSPLGRSRVRFCLKVSARDPRL